MPRAMRVCSTPGCPEVVPKGRCPNCSRRAEQRRGTARHRGYDRRHERLFRAAVLRRDPTCVCTDPDCGQGHGTTVCSRPSRHADHHPLTRRELVARGLDPNDPRHGRGLCPGCHSSHTARTPETAGGWHQR